MNAQVQLPMDSQEAVRALTQALEAEGLRVYRSFDLRAALAVLPACSCPHHGTEQCTCQYAVLLVYGDASSPVQMVAHGRDGQTWLSVPAANQPLTILLRRVLNVLAQAFPPAPPPTEGGAEATVPARPPSGRPADGLSPALGV